MSTPRFERAFSAIAAVLTLAIVGWAMVGARCSDELHARLLEGARSAPTIGERCRAEVGVAFREAVEGDERGRRLRGKHGDAARSRVNAQQE